MNLKSVVDEIDHQISALTQARNVLNELFNNQPKTQVLKSNRGGRRVMSAAARARISAAQKARWAAQKKRG